ncbi:MAG: cell division protein FtsA [Candidatus Mesenet longicola]|uniref:Cell division protein FtsA n=1 Tax=Candidatus Mesenet longicola TaxID=1892558 RepID=A0A8J3MPZ8_9RICK|nr:MAG: cell division protein FtsA [Candidatus Mesenet longicola]
MKSKVFAALDIGTTKVVCLIVKTNGSKKVVGVGYNAAEGINGGVITNIKHASRSILSAITMAKQASKIEMVDQAYVNISGCNISSFELTNEIISDRHKISDADVANVISQTYEKYDEDDVVIHNIPIRYSLDDMYNINELYGLYGGKLRADMHVVTASRPALLNIENCLVNCGVKIAGYTASSYMSGLSCLSTEEKELGAAIIDIGGGYTSIGFFEKGKFIHADFIPIGGIHITRDIAYGLCVSINEAERIKLLSGKAISSNDIDLSDDGSSSTQIAESEIIIKPRLEEILEILDDKLGKKNNLIRKVVITGGSSQLSNIAETANYILNRPIRIAMPFSIDGVSDNPEFSAAIGMIPLISENQKDDYGIEDSGINKLFDWIKEKVKI